MGQTVTGQTDLHPGNAHSRKPFQTPQVGVGMEFVAAGAAAFEVGEGDVDRGPVSARCIASSPQVGDALAETLYRVDDRGAGRLGELRRRGKRAPAVAIPG